MADQGDESHTSYDEEEIVEESASEEEMEEVIEDWVDEGAQPHDDDDDDDDDDTSEGSGSTTTSSSSENSSTTTSSGYPDSPMNSESEAGWSDRDDATSNGANSANSMDGFSSHEVGGQATVVSSMSGGTDGTGGTGVSSSFAADATATTMPLSTSTAPPGVGQEKAPSNDNNKKRKKKKKKKKKKAEPSGCMGNELDMDFVRETGKEHYRALREKKRKAEEAVRIRREAQERLQTIAEEERRQKVRQQRSTRTIFDDVDESSSSFNGDHTVDFRKDPQEEMTYARRIALKWLYKKKWYQRIANGATEDQDVMERNGTTTTNNGNNNNNTNTNSSIFRGDQSASIFLTGDADDEDQPSLARAWAYFEHVALDRYIVDEEQEKRQREERANLGFFSRVYYRFFAGERELRRAAPGTKDVKTRLFDPFNTPHSQLGNFGVAVGLYFSTVRVVGLICFIAGAINSYSMWYFASNEYMSPEAREDVPLLLQGSAVCTDTTWVYCPECNCTDDDSTRWESRKRWESDRCAFFNDTETGEELTFALKNNCDATVWQVAALNYASIMFIMLSIFMLGNYLGRAEVEFDEDQQTAQDYSILITNPPPDATDPEEWRDYFRDQCDGAEVTVCTCALDNDLLVQALVKRREIFRSIRNSLPPNAPLDILSIAQTAATQERERSVLDSLIAKILPAIPENFAYLVVMNARIQALAQLKYNTTRVFISFEREEDQRHVLEKLSIGSYRAKRNIKSALKDPKYLFRGKYVLDVKKATEPNTIHWSDLNVPYVRKIRQQLLTGFITLIGIACVAIVVRFVNEWSTVFAALTISAFNAGFPEAAKIIVLLESHDNEGSKQRSLFFKIAAFRWVNTAIVISLITPFTSTLKLENGLIPQVYAIFFSEILTLNVIQLTDGYGHFRRLCVAPLMKNQDAMNLWFRGEEVELAERYTNMTKIFFLALWYSSVYPAAFFMAALALFINYFTDRFGIMRTWKRAAHLGSEVSFISRKYFFSLANMAMAFISAYYWAGFPFDNLCDTGDDINDPNSTVTGNFTIVPDPENDPDISFNVTVSQGDSVYKYCSQDMFDGFSFPFIPSQQEERGDWMTPTQEQITTIFGWSSLGVIGVVILRLFAGFIKGFFKNRFGGFKAIGKPQGINFSEVPLISTYIPQVESWMFSYPLVVCDSDAFRKSLFDWEDPEKPHAFYDLTKDAEALMKDDEWFDKAKCFSQVRYWRPSEFDDTNR